MTPPDPTFRTAPSGSAGLRSAVDAFQPPFRICEPAAQTNCFVFNVPHAGDIYPEAFVQASRLGATELRQSEDAFVDQLFAGVVGLGAPLMSACFPRAYIDVNREPYELDPRMFASRVPAYANTQSRRVSGGLGTVPRIVADGHEIYRDRLEVSDALGRIELLYKPYHRALRTLVRHTAERFGRVVLVDCHSMPSANFHRADTPRPDIVIGDRYGASCGDAITCLFETVLRARGYTTIRNKPYAGGFITEHYGQPAAARHAIQIEINRGLYMDEPRVEPNSSFGEVAATLLDAMADAIATHDGDALGPSAIAAE